MLLGCKEALAALPALELGYLGLLPWGGVGSPRLFQSLVFLLIRASMIRERP